jgi:polysaccharide biosynthesis/export protein
MKQNSTRRVISYMKASIATAILAGALLCGGQPVMADTAPSPAPAGYVIHPGDQLSVQVFGDPSLSQSVTVLPSGDVDYPLVGAVHLAGKTTQEAVATMVAALKKYVQRPIVNIAIAQQGQTNVLVLGGVQHPGKYALPSTAHLTDAIAAAGGLVSTAQAYPSAKVTDYAGRETEIPLAPIYHDGKLTGNVAVGDGATVYVPGTELISVEVSGAVDHPGEVQLNEGDRLSMAIAKAGNGVSADSDLNNIHVTRFTADGKTQQFNIDLYNQLQHGNVASDLVMQKGDIVFIPQAKHGLNGDKGANPFLILIAGLRYLIPHIGF